MEGVHTQTPKPAPTRDGSPLQEKSKACLHWPSPQWTGHPFPPTPPPIPATYLPLVLGSLQEEGVDQCYCVRLDLLVGAVGDPERELIQLCQGAGKGKPQALGHSHLEVGEQLPDRDLLRNLLIESLAVQHHALQDG